MTVRSLLLLAALSAGLLPGCRGCLVLPWWAGEALSKGALFRAIEARDHAAVRAQLTDPAAAAQRNGSFQDQTPLHHVGTYFFDNGELQALLLSLHAPVDARDADGLTPLMRVVAAPDYLQVPENQLPGRGGEVLAQRLAAIDRLLQAGADIDAVNHVRERGARHGDFSVASETGTALHYAVWSESLEVTRRLLAHGARPDLLDAQGQPPLLVALRGGEHAAELVDLLLAAGADPRLGRTPDGLTALHRATCLPVPEPLAALLQHGADPDARDPQGRTPLMMDYLTAEQARLLLAAGAHPDLTDAAGRTALDHALARQRELGPVRAENSDTARAAEVVGVLQARSAAPR